MSFYPADHSFLLKKNSLALYDNSPSWCSSFYHSFSITLVSVGFQPRPSPFSTHTESPHAPYSYSYYIRANISQIFSPDPTPMLHTLCLNAQLTSLLGWPTGPSNSVCLNHLGEWYPPPSIHWAQAKNLVFDTLMSLIPQPHANTSTFNQGQYILTNEYYFKLSTSLNLHCHYLDSSHWHFFPRLL